MLAASLANNSSLKWASAIGIFVLLCLCALLFMLHLSVGSKSLGFDTVFNALFNFDPLQFDHVIISQLRVPRAIIAVMVGSSLAVAGAIMQGVTRNPLASPSILGMLSGASFAIVISLSLFGISSPIYTPWIAAIGALFAVVIVFLICLSTSKGINSLNLTLSGAMVSAFLAAITSLFSLLDEENYDQVRVWLTGSLAGNNMEDITLILPWMCGALFISILYCQKITVLAMGDQVAHGLGIKTTRLKFELLAVVVTLTACSVAIAGPMGFVGLVVPHIVRLIVGSDYRWIIPSSALIGAIFLLAVDIAARTIIRPEEIATGVITAMIGAPLFVYLIKMKSAQ